MVTLATYQQPEFPAALKWQVIAFMRMEWPFVFQGDGRFITEPYAPQLQPVHFAATEGDVLFSYATVFRLTIHHAGTDYQAFAFGNMFTFPPFRHEGHGHRVLTLATDYIRASGADLGMLFCDPKLQTFYASCDWQASGNQTLVGTPEHYHVHDALTMVLFSSEKGARGRADFAAQPLYLDMPPW